MVKLNKVKSGNGDKDMPPPDLQGAATLTSAPDKESRAAAETLKVLQRHQGTEGLPESTGLLTLPGKAENFKGGGLMGTVWQAYRRNWKVRHPLVTQQSTSYTATSLITTIPMKVIPLAKVLAKI